MIALEPGEWLESNRAWWDEQVPQRPVGSSTAEAALRAGRGALFPVEEAELPLVFPDGIEGARILHLQCHVGIESLVLAQRGATVVGIDFSKPAIVAARQLAAETGFTESSRFVHANVYDARHVLPQPESFDAVYATWGTVGWLPDVEEWANIIAWYLKPGGRLYFTDVHPASLEPSPTTDPVAFEWLHPLESILAALAGAGLVVDFVHEHEEAPADLLEALEPTGGRMLRRVDSGAHPLGISIVATAR